MIKFSGFYSLEEMENFVNASDIKKEEIVQIFYGGSTSPYTFILVYEAPSPEDSTTE